MSGGIYVEEVHSLFIELREALLLQPDKHIGAVVRGHAELLDNLSDMRQLAGSLERCPADQLHAFLTAMRCL